MQRKIDICGRRLRSLAARLKLIAEYPIMKFIAIERGVIINHCEIADLTRTKQRRVERRQSDRVELRQVDALCCAVCDQFGYCFAGRW
jgi:hypothetical protein